MPNEMIVGAVQPMTGSAEKPADSRADPFTAPQATSSTESPQSFVNPTLKFDSTLGLLVIEFRDTSGNMNISIPSQRQLEAYRLHEQPLPGQKQPVAHAVVTDEPPAVTPTPAAAPVPPTTHGAPAAPAIVSPVGKT